MASSGGTRYGKDFIERSTTMSEYDQMTIEELKQRLAQAEEEAERIRNEIEKRRDRSFKSWELKVTKITKKRIPRYS